MGEEKAITQKNERNIRTQNNSINMKSYSIKLPCYVVAFAFDVFHFP